MGRVFVYSWTASLWVRAIADHLVAEALDQLLDVHGDQRLVLDDHDLGGHLAGNLHRGLVEQPGEFAGFGDENFGAFLVGKPFDGDQQERLARLWREVREIGGGTLLPGERPGGLGNTDGGRGEEGGEELVERDPVVGRFGEDRHVGDKRFEGCRDIGVAGGLRAGDGTRKTPQIRQMRSDPHGQSHCMLPIDAGGDAPNRKRRLRKLVP